MLGFKVFDNDSMQQLESLFSLAINDNLAIEVALYNNNSNDFVNRMKDYELYQKLSNKSIHLNYRNYLVNNIKEDSYYQNMIKELHISKELGINRGVIHYQSPKNYKIHLENLTKEALIENLSILNNTALEHDFLFYIENTFIFKSRYPLNNLVHHKIIWDTILELNFEQNIGICLDWGHVKSFTDDPLTDWIDYVSQLKSRGMPIYMHVHDNNSQKDQHLSLKESNELSLFQYNHKDDAPYIDILSKIQNNFKDDSLILEYGTEIAKEHYLWTKEKIYAQQNIN